MGAAENAAVYYSKAVQLLVFLLVEAPSLILIPPFSLTNSDRYRLQTYIDVLSNRQSRSRSQRMALLKCEDQKCITQGMGEGFNTWWQHYFTMYSNLFVKLFVRVTGRWWSWPVSFFPVRQEKLIYSNANSTDQDGYGTRVYRISTRNLITPLLLHGC